MYLIILLVEARKLALVAYIYLPNVCMYVCKLTCNPHPYPRPYTLVLFFSLYWFGLVLACDKEEERDSDLGSM